MTTTSPAPRLPVAVAVATLIACAGFAPAPADPSLGPPPGVAKGYLKPGDLDGKAIIGPPPAADSPQGRADRAIFDETRALQGSARWRTAIQDNDLWAGGALKRFSCALGGEIGAKQTPVTWKILHKLEMDVRTVGTPAKDFYDRKRPLIGNDAPICVPREDWMRTNASYPSGHSMTAWSWALVLAELRPDRADPLLALGKDSGDSRVVCGVHFLSDVEAGRTLGSAMVSRLHADKAFAADMAKAKKELARSVVEPQGCPIP